MNVVVHCSEVCSGVTFKDCLLPLPLDNIKLLNSKIQSYTPGDTSTLENEGLLQYQLAKSGFYFFFITRIDFRCEH